MWRNVTPAVDAVAAIDNYLLPAWMIGLGAWLIVRSVRMAGPVEDALVIAPRALARPG
jgi:hypothetical protein